MKFGEFIIHIIRRTEIFFPKMAAVQIFETSCLYLEEVCVMQNNIFSSALRTKKNFFHNLH